MVNACYVRSRVNMTNKEQAIGSMALQVKTENTIANI